MNNTFLFVFFISLIAFSCKTKEVVSPDKYKGDRLVLSHGGGFTGAYKTYHLLDNGQLFKATNEFEGLYAMNSLESKTVDQIFSNYDVLGIGDEKMESYGNLNYSITMINKSGEEHKLIWEKGQNGSEKLQLFYGNIMSQIQLSKKVEKEIVR